MSDKAQVDNKYLYAMQADKIYDKRYNSPYPLRRYVHRAQYVSIMQYIGHGDKVLDAGCGDGVLSCLMADNGAEVTGIDISEPNIKAAKELAKQMSVEHRTTFMIGDAENIPFPNESFDTVISCHVLEHLPDFDKGFNELCRITSNKIIVALPTILNLCSMIQVGHGGFWEKSRKSLFALPLGLVKTIIHLFGEGVNEGYMGNPDLVHIWRYPWVVKSRLQRNGFIIEHFEASTISLPYFSFLLPLIKFLDRGKSLPILRNFGYGSTVVLKKK